MATWRGEAQLEFSAPVVVAGGGACGAVAALAARSAGAEVLLLEQDATPRGSTAMSQGLICAAGTRAQQEAGIEDDPEIFFADIIAKTRGETDPVLARAIAGHAGPTIDWLTEAHDLPYDLDIRFKPSYGHSRARVHGWIGRSGEDLVQFLHGRLAAAGVDVMLRAKLVDLIEDEPGHVAGVVVERPDGTEERIGCGALVLATCGFGASRRLVARHMPELENAPYHGHEGNNGLGIELGARVGGALSDMGSYQGYGMLADPHGIPLPPGHIVEGGVLLNAKGERFVDEMADIAGMVHPVLAQAGGFVWAVYDAAIERICAYMPETSRLMELKAVREAATIEDLAGLMAVDASLLAAVLGDATAAANEQRPDSVGRLWRTGRPPAAPYRAIRVRGALFHTQGGLQIDATARVLRPDGSALPNLLAGGGAARGLSGPSFWGYLPAMGLCAAVTFGRLAGLSAAGVQPVIS
jgi:fumarate reductase flavoprotein subunit